MSDLLIEPQPESKRITAGIPRQFAVPRRTPLEIKGPAKALMLYDLHIPFHTPEAIEAAIALGKKRGVTHVIIGGDMLDFYQPTRWLNNPAGGPDLASEIEAGREFIAYLRKKFPKAVIVYKEGNHEERLERYVWANAPKIWGAVGLTLRDVLAVDEFKINFVGHKRFINLGKLLVLHGHEYRWGGNPLVSPARWLWLRTKENSICGHFHQHGEYSENTARGRIITAWTVGNLSTLTPDFMPYNNWTNGFAFVDVDKDGAFNVENYKFYKGKVWT